MVRSVLDPEFKMLLCHLGGAHSGNAGLEFVKKKGVEGVENKGIGMRCPDSLAPLQGPPSRLAFPWQKVLQKKSLEPTRMNLTTDYKFTGVVI